MSEFKPGDRVRITIEATVEEVCHHGHEDGHELKYRYAASSGEQWPCGVLYDAPSVTVEHMLPEIQPGDMLTDGQGGVWFAQRYFADFDNPMDWEGCNGSGWRTVLVPLNGGPYGDGSGMRPEEANELRAPFTVVHHEDEREMPS